MQRLLPEAVNDAGFPFSLVAPTGGWNARDNIAKMPATDALVMDNFWPSTTSVDIRQGSVTRATLSAGSIQSLLGLSLADGAFKRFAATSGGIYDITAGGTGIAAVSSACTSGKWEHLNLNIGGTPYLWACCGDGTNKSRIYNGTTGTWVILDGASVPAITGVTSENISNVSLFKNRLIVCLKDSLQFAYGPLNSVAGAFNLFDLGPVFRRGGYLVATGTWSIDAGAGVDDIFVAVTSEGECAIYRGTDPSSASTFALVGVYDLGRPVGKRCLFKLAGDLGVLTEQGLYPISKALLSASVDRRVALTDKIQQAFNTYFKLYSAQYGWQGVLFSSGPAIVVNVPIGAASSYQFLMNTMTGAWCRFSGWDAACLLVQGGKLYFAIGTTVKEGWIGTADDSTAITCAVATAFQKPVAHRGMKVNLVRPIFQTSAPLSLSMALDTDYQAREALATIASLGSGGEGWDTAIWDTATWADGLTMVNKWKMVRHRPGKAFSLRLKCQSKNIAASWAATDFLCERAGIHV